MLAGSKQNDNCLTYRFFCKFLFYTSNDVHLGSQIRHCLTKRSQHLGVAIKVSKDSAHVSMYTFARQILQRLDTHALVRSPEEDSTADSVEGEGVPFFVWF
jgi:hypothetical protein